jgi:DNA-formamidopyrimidine glycosylase
MPEAPEVRRTTDWLKINLVNKIIRDINVGGRFIKQPIQRLEELKGRKVIGVRCKGKVIVLDFEDNISAVSTLGMSGMWTNQERKHVALTLWCELPPTRGILPIFYVDQRRFGNFVVTDTRVATSRLDVLGWDPFSDPTAYGKARLRSVKYAKLKICDVLLKQDVFAGVGNYIRAEAMYRARLNPNTILLDMSDCMWNSLCVAIANVIKESYFRGGATLENFFDGDGNRGNQVDFLEVYGKTHDSAGNPIVKFRCSSDRTVWWCPAVQV